MPPPPPAHPPPDATMSTINSMLSMDMETLTEVMIPACAYFMGILDIIAIQRRVSECVGGFLTCKGPSTSVQSVHQLESRGTLQ